METFRFKSSFLYNKHDAISSEASFSSPPVTEIQKTTPFGKGRLRPSNRSDRLLKNKKVLTGTARKE